MTIRYYQTSHRVVIVDRFCHMVEVEPPENGADPRFVDWPKFDEGIAHITWLARD